MSFWTSGTGKTLTGKPEDAFVRDFSIIPDGTQAEAMIKHFILIDRPNEYTGSNDKYYEILYKLITGDFKGREVSQKIKCFAGKPEQIDRNLNMMKLIMELCDFKPKHSNEPTDADLMPMQGKMVSIKISEWSMEKKDGSGMMEGNFVSEVHKSGAIPTETGTKQIVTKSPSQKKGVESALTRNQPQVEMNMDDDIPF